MGFTRQERTKSLFSVIPLTTEIISLCVHDQIKRGSDIIQDRITNLYWILASPRFLGWQTLKNPGYEKSRIKRCGLKRENWRLGIPSGSHSSTAINPCNLSVHCNREPEGMHYLKLKATGGLCGILPFLNWVLWYFNFFFFSYHDFDTPLLKHAKLCDPSHLSIKIPPKKPNCALG